MKKKLEQGGAFLQNISQKHLQEILAKEFLL